MSIYRLNDAADIDLSFEISDTQFRELESAIGSSPLTDAFRDDVSAACRLYSGSVLNRLRSPKAAAAKKYLVENARATRVVSNALQRFLSVESPLEIDSAGENSAEADLPRLVLLKMKWEASVDLVAWGKRADQAERFLSEFTKTLEELAAASELDGDRRGAEPTGRNAFVDRLLAAYESQTGRTATAGSEKNKSAFVCFLETVNCTLSHKLLRVPGNMRDHAKRAIRRRREGRKDAEDG